MQILDGMINWGKNKPRINTKTHEKGMYRAYVNTEGKAVIEIYKD